MYTVELVGLIEQHGFRSHLYADDTQVCGSSRPSAVYDLQQRLSACVDDFQCWMQFNRLQLNASKSEVLWCSTLAGNISYHSVRSASALTPSFRRQQCETSAYTLMLTLVCGRMFSGLLLAVLLSYASCAVYGDLFLRLYIKRSS